MRREKESASFFRPNLRRSRDDALRAAQVRANVRVCKGIYVESPSIAYQGREEIRDSYAQMVDSLLTAGCYVGIATHDEALVERALATIRRLRLPPEVYEFQMLLGVAGALRRRLVASGHRLRVYVPFGEGWQAFSEAFEGKPRYRGPRRQEPLRRRALGVAHPRKVDRRQATCKGTYGEIAPRAGRKTLAEGPSDGELGWDRGPALRPTPSALPGGAP